MTTDNVQTDLAMTAEINLYYDLFTLENLERPAPLLIGVCGGIPGDLDTNPVYKPFAADTFYLYGDDDEFYTQEQFRTFNEKLAAMLPNYRSKHYTAKHEITEEMRDDIKVFLRQIDVK